MISRSPGVSDDGPRSNCCVNALTVAAVSGLNTSNPKCRGSC